jgi:mannose-1-phosphate guanylyltransferase
MNKRWAIVLAGGEGERLRPFIKRWLGRHRPKQYCAFSGGKTMLEHTFSRAAGLVPPERTLTVIGRGHRDFLGPASSYGRIVEQPDNRDTAPGLFLPALHVLEADPEATLLIFPSDHFIAPGGVFLDRMRQAVELAERREDRLILLGAVPDGPETDFGWIEPGPLDADDGSRPVASFLEKPNERDAAMFFRDAYLWNTMIMAVKARTLWRMGRRLLPALIKTLEGLRGALGTSREAAALAKAYERMPPINFSKAILERCPEETLVMPMHGVEWSDWGRPARISQTLRHSGRRSRFPESLACACQ